MKTTLALAALLAMAAATGPALASERDLAEEVRQKQLEEQAFLAQRQTQLQELVARMDAESRELAATRDAGRRAELLEAHRATMLEAMEVLRDLGGETMHEVMSAHLEDSGSAGQRPTAAPQPHHEMLAETTSSDNAQRLNRLEMRLDMMQVVIEDLLAHQVQ